MNHQSIGPYRLSQRLGAGGMGEVWKARRRGFADTSKDVALKLVRDELDDLPALRDMFVAEARRAMRFNNANIVQTFDAGQTPEGRCYMVMEFVDGLDLAKLGERLRAAGEQMPTELVAYIAGEILKALVCIHELGDELRPALVHRDLTPDNVMLSTWGEVKLMDFGISRPAAERVDESYAAGKLRYLSPEQLTGDGCDPTIDMFALGAIIHELLDGRRFRSSFEGPELYELVAEGRVAPLQDSSSIPEALRSLLDALLVPDPKLRLASAREAYRRLSSWSGYRDASFELEALVRRFVTEPSPGPAPLDRPETPDSRWDSPTRTWTEQGTPNSGPRTPTERGPWRQLAVATLACLASMAIAGGAAALTWELERCPAPQSLSLDHPSPVLGERWAPWHSAPALPAPLPNPNLVLDEDPRQALDHSQAELLEL